MFSLFLITEDKNPEYNCLRDFPGFRKLKESTVNYCVCMICYKNPNVSLDNALISSPDYSPSNAGTHMKNKHKHDAPEYWDVITQKQQPAAIGKNHITISFLKLSQKNAVANFHKEAHRFITNCGLPFRVANSNAFHNYNQFLVLNAHLLKNNIKDLKMGPRKFGTIANKNFSEMVFVVAELVTKTREWYKENLGKQTPFLTVCHDIWQGNQIDVLGVSLYFNVPTTWETVKFPVALIKSDSKTASSVKDNILHALSK